MKCKNKVIHLKRPGKGPDCEWLTLYEGQDVPKEWEGPFDQQGGQALEEPKVEEPVKEEIKERVEDFKEDLADDGKRNYSNEPDKKSPGRKKKRF